MASSSPVVYGKLLPSSVDACLASADSVSRASPRWATKWSSTPKALKLIGYHGDERPERAQVIIRRSQLDSESNDIGFARGPMGVSGTS
jgi:hypothetical protein